MPFAVTVAVQLFAEVLEIAVGGAEVASVALRASRLRFATGPRDALRRKDALDVTADVIALEENSEIGAFLRSEVHYLPAKGMQDPAALAVVLREGKNGTLMVLIDRQDPVVVVTLRGCVAHEIRVQ